MRKILSSLSVLLLIFVLVACGSRSYTVTFESNGGSDVVAIEDVELGSTITAPIAPTRQGYTFDGWFTESTLTNKWNFATDVVIENITLHAKWNAVIVVTDQDKVDAAHAWLSLGDLDDLDADDRVIMPTSYTVNGVAISWAIDKEEFISVANGRITQPDHETGDQTVTITATLTLGSSSRTKVFTATVKALPIPSEADPFVSEDFSGYNDGNLIGQGDWATVSGKEGLTTYTVVSSISGLTIPAGSKAVEVKDYTETQTTIALNFTTDVWVLEMDFMQTANGAPIRLQPQTSGTGLQFGFSGAGSDAARVYYRNPATQVDHAFDLPLNTWHTLRLEVDMVNKTFEIFVYEDGNLMPVTPGPVSWGTYSPTFSQLYIRSGSSNATNLNENPSYFTNIIGNNIEAMPRPVETVKLGDVTGIRESVTLPEGGSFVVDTPVIYNYYGTQRELVLDTDYTLAVDNPVDVDVADEYVVTYTFTSVTDPMDIVVITQDVVIFSEGQPNEITAVDSTEASYLDPVSSFTVTTIQPEGTLYYILGTTATETAAAILLGDFVVIDSVTTVIEDINVGENTYIHFVVELNGNSNVWSYEINHEAVIEITTEQAFFEMATIETSQHYALMNNLDFSSFTWVATNASFKGVLYGNGYTISNITINTAVGYGGVFARANGAVIRDLIFDNIHVTTTARAGILVGRIENADVHIENIIIMNSSVQGADSNGVGGVIGQVSRATYMSNVAIIDSVVTVNGQKNIGGVVGRVDSAPLYAEDIYVRNVTVTAAVSGTDVAAGGFVGYVRDNVASVVTANRVIIVETKVDSVMGGALIGYNRLPGTADITNAYVEVTFTYLEPTHAGLIGRVNDVSSHLDQTTIFGSITGAVTNAQSQDLTNVVVPSDEAWWTTNLPVFGVSSLWTLDYNNIYALAIYLVTTKPMHEITLDYNEVVLNETVMVREDEEFAHVVPDVTGYMFVGWYLDDAFATELPANYVITGPVTLYGKYETVPASTVTFTSNVDGLSIPSQEVNYGDFATEPVVEDQMIEGVMKEVVGWTLDGVSFSFTTPIEGAIELVAVWQTKTYTVTFDGEDAVVYEYGELVLEPTTNPTHIFAEVTFNEWRLEGVAYDFNLPVTGNINLVSSFNEPVGNISITTAEQFHYMATVESTYSFVLANDIDFVEFNWVDSGNAFKGSFDGQMFMVSNISINAVNGYGGIFARANGAYIQNLRVYNLSVTTTARAGGLIGRVENASTTIENISIINSSITGSDANGVGGLIGLVSFETFVFNVAIVDTMIENVAQKNVGGLVGRVDGGALVADDIFISGVLVKTTNTGTGDVAASAFVGYVRDSAASVVSAIRVVVINTTVESNVGGAFVGYNRYPGTADLMDAYFEVTFMNTGARSGLIGYNRDQVVVLDQTSIFGSFIGATTHTQVLDLVNTAVPTDQAWWDTNLNAFTLSSLWTIGVDGSIILNIADFVPVVSYTLTFDVDGGSTVDPQDVVENEMAILPADPIKDGYAFVGWFKDAGLTMAWNFGVDVVTENTTLYAKWEFIPIEVTTVQEFYDMATLGLHESYVLMNDLDFTGFTWTYVNYNFTRELNGNGKTISNLTITGAGDRAGIFSRANGANIYDLTIDNANIDSPAGRAGILIGEVDGSSVTISNVTIMNSAVSGNKGEGVGILIGYTKSGATIENVRIINSTALNANKNVGFITGRAQGSMNITDTYIFGSTATSTNASTDSGVGGFVGYTNLAGITITITRSVIEDSILDGRGAGALVGYYKLGSLVATDVFTDIEFTYTGIDGQHGIIGRITVADTTAPVLSNVFGHFVGQQIHVDAVDLEPAFKLADLTGLDQTWWTTNLSGLTGNAGWSFNVVSKFYTLS